MTNSIVSQHIRLSFFLLYNIVAFSSSLLYMRSPQHSYCTYECCMISVVAFVEFFFSFSLSTPPHFSLVVALWASNAFLPMKVKKKERNERRYTGNRRKRKEEKTSSVISPLDEYLSPVLNDVASLCLSFSLYSMSNNKCFIALLFYFVFIQVSRPKSEKEKRISST